MDEKTDVEEEENEAQDGRKKIEKIFIFQGWRIEDGESKMKVGVETQRDRHFYKLGIPEGNFDYDKVRSAKVFKDVDSVKKIDGPTKEEILWAQEVSGSKKRVIIETLCEHTSRDFYNPYMDETERREEKLEKLIEKTLYYDHVDDSHRIEFLKNRYEANLKED